MITATRTPPRTERLCARCGLTLNEPRKTTRNCASCNDVERSSNSKTATQRGRAIAKAQGWNWDVPHEGPWGTA